MKSRERSAFRFKLMPKHRWKNFYDEPLIERDNEIRPRREHMSIGTRQGIATRNIYRDRQPLRRIGTPGVERFDARWIRE
ncbi:MAG TPA: hypothetical protein VGJ20_19785 [Xanthobacteraceae bacterium]|jgi:hypothetical protein